MVQQSIRKPEQTINPSPNPPANLQLPTKKRKFMVLQNLARYIKNEKKKDFDKSTFTRKILEKGGSK
jgi:hypothetical protein